MVKGYLKNSKSVKRSTGSKTRETPMLKLSFIFGVRICNELKVFERN
jgi:hypothetical protein